MRWSDLPFKPSDRMLREFAGLCAVILAALATWHGLLRGNGTLGSALMVAALAVGAAGLAWPGLLRPVFVALLVLTFPVGWLVSRVLIVLLFFALVTPVAVFLRLRGRDVLQLKRRQRDSYWAAKTLSSNPASYYRQF